MATTRATHKREIKAIIDGIGLTDVTVTSVRKNVYDTLPLILIDSGSIDIQRVDTDNDVWSMQYDIHVIDQIDDNEANTAASIDKIDDIVIQIMKELRTRAAQNTTYWIDSTFNVSALHNGAKVGLGSGMIMQTITLTIQQSQSY